MTYLLLFLFSFSSYAQLAEVKPKDDCGTPEPLEKGTTKTISTLNEKLALTLPLKKKSYITPEEYREFTSRELGEKLIKRIQSACDEVRGDKTGPTIGEQSDIMMYVPYGVLESVAKYGFQNQHVTRTTKGCDCRDDRLDQENKLSGLSLGYGSKGKDLLPKYSALNVRNPKHFKEPGLGNAKAYGEVIFVFKEDVKKRTSWTESDSLGIGDFRGSPMANTLSFKESDGKPFICGGGYGYCEAQIWGELDFTDVDYVMIEGDSVPDVLKANGLKVYQQVEGDNSSTGVKKGKLLEEGNPKLIKRPAISDKVPEYEVEIRVWTHIKLKKTTLPELQENFKSEKDVELKREILGEIVTRKDPKLKDFLLQVTEPDKVIKGQVYLGLAQYGSDKAVRDFLLKELKNNKDNSQVANILASVFAESPFIEDKKLQEEVLTYLTNKNTEYGTNPKQVYDVVSGKTPMCPPFNK